MNGLPGCGWLPSLRRSVIKVAFFLAVHPARPPPYSAFCAELPLLPKSIAFLRDRAIFSVRDSFCPQLFSSLLTEGELMKAKKQMACPFIRPPQGLSQRDIEFLTSSSASCLIKGSAPARLYAPRSRSQHDYSAHRCTADSSPYVIVFCRVSSLVVAMARWHLDALPLRSSSCANERMACKFLQAQYFPVRPSASVLHATKVPCVSA